MEQVSKFKEQRICMKPGWKLCPTCRKKLKESDSKVEIADSHEVDIDFIPTEEKADSLNVSISSLPGVSPLKPTQVGTRDIATYGKRKWEEVKEITKEKIAECLNLPPEMIAGTSSQSMASSHAQDDIDYLVAALKQKLKTSSRQQQVSLLTLAPKSWTIAKVAHEFKVTEYTVRKARHLQRDCGILPMVPSARGKPLSDDDVLKVKQFYCEDDVSRVMPGAKDYVSVREGDARVHKQRRLLLLNLNELHIMYKEIYPQSKVGLSKFCELRPKECVTVGARGTHSVCVCTIHQNVKLMLADIPAATKITYHDLIEQFVCSKNNPDCMLHTCDKCPGPSVLQQYLFDKCAVQSDCLEMVTYKQWETTDRTTLNTYTKPLDEFIDVLVRKTEKLVCHDYIARQQAEFLRNLKSTMDESEMTVLLDFAENYSFIVQDAAQGYHWDNTQCTLHPFVLYNRKDGECHCTSIVIISNGLKHDTVAVHKFQECMIKFVKEIYPRTTKIHYFSDGAAAQYKNYKNFANLIQHKEDFGIAAEWHFFATSHGKSPCDGVGGTVKRTAARASLQATTGGFLLTPEDLYKWCKEHISGIKFIWVEKDEIEEHGKELENRFLNARKIPATRDNHCFIPGKNFSVKLQSDMTCSAYVI